VPQNLSQDVVKPLQHFVVPESQYAKSALGENCAALRVEVDAIGVLCTVDFDNQVGLDTNEVDDVAADWNLSPKLEPRQAPCTQVGPQQALHFGVA
jgi:hypothetical protein